MSRTYYIISQFALKIFLLAVKIRFIIEIKFSAEIKFTAWK